MMQVCLNGARTPREHHHLPVRPEELARAAADSVAAGATEVHLHPKSADGTDTLDPTVVAATLRAVRAAVPAVPVGMATSVWTSPDAADRSMAIGRWTVLPDRALVPWHEPGADEVASALLRRGVAVEAEVPSGTDGDERLRRSPLRHRLLRVVATVSDLTAKGAPRTAEGLLQRMRSVGVPVLLHGQGAGAWPVVRLALRRGLPTRIGLEDTLLLPDGQIASDNAELVAAAMRLRAADSPAG